MTQNRPAVSLPNMKGLSEEMKRVFAKHGVEAYFKPKNTLRQLLCSPKDPTKKVDVVGPVYHIKCTGHEGIDCDSEYIGETERTLKARFAEHRRPSTTSSEVSKHIHQDCPGHRVAMDDVKILDREPKWFERGVKEAIYIRTRRPDLNRDGGRYQLPHLWDRLLQSRDRLVRDCNRRH